MSATALLAAVVTMATLTSGTFAQGAEQSSKAEAMRQSLAEFRNMDARVGLIVAAAVPLAGQQAEVADLRALMPDLRVDFDQSTGATKSLWNMGGFLTPPDGRDPRSIAEDYMASRAGLLGLADSDVVDVELTDEVYSSLSGVTHLYYRQRVSGIPLFNAQLQFNITKDGRILSVNNAFLPNATAAIKSLRPALDAAAAVRSAGAHLGVSNVVPAVALAARGVRQTTDLTAPELSTEPITAELMILPVSKGAARLVWNFPVWTLDSEHAFDLTVDAETGQVWTRIDWVAADSYRVYPRPVESPNHTTPLPPADGRSLVTNPANATASPFGWHDTNGVAGAEFLTTEGNNVSAYTDVDANNVPDPGSSPSCGAGLACDFALDLTQAPSAYRPAAVTNLFYWNNIIHDVQYRYGFDEVGGNFQVNNYGRGGLGADSVQAEAQDGSGTNNANFATPPDGSRPRMQMFNWTAPTPDRDGDLDASVIVHEYSHGISNRLVGGPSNVSCLGNQQQPGEGISDWLALAYTAVVGQTGPQGRGIGTYVLNQPTTGTGIRALPYSTDNAVNNWTYQSITGMAIPHGVGSVWAQGMWEVYWALVNFYGFDPDLYNATGGAGNQRAMLYHNEGLKNTACSPGFTQVRDGIIQAAQTINGGADVCRIWTAFAGFGLGSDALNPNSNSTSGVVNGFNVPVACGGTPPPNISINDVSVTEGNSGTASATFTVSLGSTSAVESRVNWATADGTATAVETPVTAAGTITVNDNAAATPYPATATASGLAGTITSLAVRLNGVSHTFPGDLEVMLRGPGGQTVMLMSDAGGTNDLVAADLTFRDGAPPLPATAITPGGTYAPTDLTPTGDSLPAPAPAAPYGAALSAFNGTDPNGTWQLYVADDAGVDTGNISGGFTLLIGTSATGDYQSGSGQLIFPAGTTSQTVTVLVNGDTAVEADETFAVNLSNPFNGVIVDGQGIGTIVNDDGGGGSVPTTAADSYGTPFNTALTVPAPGILANDNTNGGGAMTAQLVSGPASGTLGLNADGSFTYTPAAGFSGAATFTYRAVNGVGPGNAATVTVTVAGGAPTTVDDGFSTTYPSALNVAAPGVLGNDNANGGGAMTAVLVTNATNGTLALGANGSVSYTPNFGFAGTDTFTYQAVNGAGNGNVATVTITVAPPTNVQAPYNFRVDSVVGNTVTLRWDALPIGPQASTFILEGGAAPGQVLASIPTGSASPVYTFVAPTGSWFIRMHGQLGADKSGASNEVPLFVNVPVTPSAPSRLTGLVNGNTLELAWKNTFGGGAPTGTVLDVTGSFVGSLPLGPVERFSFSPVPGGTYTFRVRESNGGGPGPASDPLTLTFPGGCTGVPALPANFLGYRVGNTAYVMWDPPASGAAATSYLLDVSGSFVGTFPTTGRVLSGLIGPGAYNVRVQAINACGVSAFTPTQVITFP